MSTRFRRQCVCHSNALPQQAMTQFNERFTIVLFFFVIIGNRNVLILICVLSKPNSHKRIFIICGFVRHRLIEENYASCSLLKLMFRYKCRNAHNLFLRQRIMSVRVILNDRETNGL